MCTNKWNEVDAKKPWNILNSYHLQRKKSWSKCKNQCTFLYLLFLFYSISELICWREWNYSLKVYMQQIHQSTCEVFCWIICIPPSNWEEANFIFTLECLMSRLGVQTSRVGVQWLVSASLFGLSLLLGVKLKQTLSCWALVLLEDSGINWLRFMQLF